MTNYKKLYELMSLAQQAIDTSHYGRCEKLLRQLLQEAFETGDNKIIAEVSTAFMEFHRLHAIEALKILKRIDPIQAKRKDLS